jgi:hypothetical protein
MRKDEAMPDLPEDTALDERDLLPDLASGRLDDVSLSRLRRAVAGDASLRDELAVIEAVRAAAPQVTVDIGRIVAALPAPPVTPRVIDLGARRAERAHLVRWQWRTAAAVAVMIAGASSVLWRSPAATVDTPPVVAVDLASGTLASAVALEELSDEELQSMLTRLEQFDGAAVVDTLDDSGEEAR